MRLAATRLAPLILALAGCPEGDDDDSTLDGSSLEGRCDLGTTGPEASVVPSLGASAMLASVSTAAQNTMDIENASPLGTERLGSIRIGPCGEIGVAGIDAAQAPAALFYRDLSSATSDLLGPASGQRPGLLFDDDCSPLVLATSGSTVVEHRRDGGGWLSGVAFDAAPLGVDGGIWLFSVDPGRDGLLHLLALGTSGGGAILVYGSRSPAAGSPWSAEIVPAPPAASVFDLAVDSQGRIHAVYDTMEFPCDPCDVALRHAVLLASGWEETIVEEGLWGPPHDELSVDPSLAIGPQDRPVIAASFMTRAVTGSVQSQSLRVYAEGDGEFCAEEAVVSSDGYAGSDGGQFSGSTPSLGVDDSGRLHVLFADLAAWHAQGYSNTVTGQIRYALRSGSAWQVETLLSQPGQTEQPDPLEGVVLPSLAISPDGDSAAAAWTAWTWSTDSIYNDSAVPLDVETTLAALQGTGR